MRNAAVLQLSELRPEQAERFWAGHPQVETSAALAKIGRAARERRQVDPAVLSVLSDVAAKAPLAAQPYLVRGVQAQTSGDRSLALRAFEQAQWRDPRSLPAAYFLADHYLRSGKPLQGLQQVALFARLSGGTNLVAPYVAQYARDPAHWPAVRAMIAAQPDLAEAILAALANDPANTDAVLAIADPAHRRPDSAWLANLLSALVDSGQYARARAIWATVGKGGQQSGLIYDTGFASPAPPPPFNWSFAASTIGLAERQPGGQLHVIFYGNVDGVLAKQLLTLPPGNYRLAMHLAAPPSHAETLGWSIRCDKAGEAFATATLTEAAAHGWTFQVPANCPAQWLELSGRSADVSQQAEAIINRLSLAKVGSGE